jgi:hypothetical protein
MLCPSRVSTIQASSATPRPTASAMKASRQRRQRPGSGALSAGSQCSASIIRISVTISTSNCVSARSGAEK